MAVVDVYANPLYVAGVAQKMLKNVNSNGCELSVMRENVTVGATDNNLSQYRVFKNLNPSIVPVMILVANTANTAGTNYGLGLYKTGIGGAAVAATCFAAAMDMSVAALFPIPGVAKNGMAAVSLSNYNKTLWEHAGVTDVKNRPNAYDLVLTATVVGTAGGTITVTMFFFTNG